MGKGILVGVIVSLAMTSCKKDYTCTCTNVSSIGTSSFVIQKAKKNDAQVTCDQTEETYKVTSSTATCDLQ